MTKSYALRGAKRRTRTRDRVLFFGGRKLGRVVVVLMN